MNDYEKILLTLDSICVKIEEMVEIVEELKGSVEQVSPYIIDELAVEGKIE